MKLGIPEIRSRVGRRIFLLFICCSLIPIVLMSYVAFYQVSTSLLAASEQRNFAAVKNYEMDILEHMESLDSDLRILARNRLALSDVPKDALSAHWKSVQYLEIPAEWDGVIEGIALSPEKQRHLANGESVVAVAGNPASVTMFHSVRPGYRQRCVLVGHVNHNFLFSGSETPGEGELEVREVGGPVVYRSSNLDGDTSEARTTSAATGAMGEAAASGAYESIRRDVFLRAKFSSDPWRITYRQKRADVLGPVKGFRTSFPLILLLSVWMVLLLSTVQIRRTLAPLVRLRDAVTEFGNLNYEPVSIAAKDEFGDLASAFNRMQQRLYEQFNALDDFNWGTLRALARAIDAKSRWTAGHSERVTELAVRIAKQMQLPAEDITILQRGGLVHDIGKIGTPQEILDKPGRLTAAEMEIMRNHVTVGASILEPIPAFKTLIPIVLEHHERFDGGGYPRGLAGNEISLHARILSVADVYDALTSERPYRGGLPREQVIGMIVEGSGTQFDPMPVEAFLQLLRREEEGREATLGPEEERYAEPTSVVAGLGSDFLPRMPAIGNGAAGTGRDMADRGARV